MRKKKIAAGLLCALVFVMMPCGVWAEELLVGGQAVGIEISSDGVIVSGFSMVETDAGAVAHAERLAAFSRLHGLTARETDVLAHLVRGRALAAIAERLCVSTGTVKTHALHIYAKTGVHSRQELMDLFEATAPDGREDVAPAGGPTGVSTSDASSQEVTYHATRIDEGQARARR